MITEKVSDLSSLLIVSSHWWILLPHYQCSPVTLQRQHNTFWAKNNFCFPFCLRKRVWKPETLLFQTTSPTDDTCVRYSPECVVQSSQHQTRNKAWKQQIIESLGQPRHSPLLRMLKMFESLSEHPMSLDRAIWMWCTQRGQLLLICATCVLPEGFPFRAN